jgi:hypothetical protein
MAASWEGPWGQDLYDALEGKTDLHRVLGDTPALFVKTNFGRSIRLFSSTYHNTTLFGIGATAETAFGCEFSYLLRLNNESLRLVADEFATLNDPGILSIGIQIREGDQVMKSPLKPSNNQISTDDNRRRFLDCADTIERQLENIYEGKRQIMWYLVSDSIETRREMKNAIGDKIIVNIRDETMHSRHYALKLSGQGGKGATDQGAMDATTNQEVIGALRLAAAENWLFALTDYQVFSGWSGYARIAAARSTRTGTAFQMEGYYRDGEFRIRDKNCSLNHSDDIVQILATSGAGL